jgi:hypothetical protein
LWGIVPAAGVGSRIQPLAFSKELLPVGSRHDVGVERPRAVSEYLVERMVRGGAGKICFVISPGKSDILEYYAGGVDGAYVCYAVQSQPAGLCDAIFRALPLVAENEPVIVGLPDTVWFPGDALCFLPATHSRFCCFRWSVPRFLARLNEQGYEVVVFTVRWAPWVEDWLRAHGLAELVARVTDKKCATHVYVDDRAVCFEGDYAATLDRIAGFKAYWECDRA